MLLKESGWFAGPVVAMLVAAVGCGSRTELSPVGGKGPGEPCQDVSDCPNDPCTEFACVLGGCQLVDEVECVSDDPCFTSTCNPETGRCLETRKTLDQDRDGFFGPLPGTVPGAPDACGDDCDDTRAAAFPGGIERCDGVDNDCDGVIDNGSRYLGEVDMGTQAIPVFSEEQVATAGRSLAFGAGSYVAGYWGRPGPQQSKRSFISGFDANGMRSFAETPVTNVNATSFGPAVGFDGANFGAVWSDPRVDNNYEVYFARFSPSGDKLGPDLRLTDAPDFSVNSQVLYDQGRYVVVFDDRRNETDALDQAEIYAQFVNPQGQAVGGNRRLTPVGQLSENPALAATASRYGLAYTLASPDGSFGVAFRSFDKDFGNPSPVRTIVAENAANPSVVALGNQFVVSWDVNDGQFPGDRIFGRVVSAAGEPVSEAVPLTAGAAFARSQTTQSLGDRVLLVWSDAFEGNFEIYAKVLDSDLQEVEQTTRLTFSEADSLASAIALGQGGQIGILFNELGDSDGAFLTTIGCDANPSACDCSGCLTGGECPDCCDVF